MRFLQAGLVIVFAAASVRADIVAGKGHDETIKVCSKCHPVETIESVLLNRAGWTETVSRMMDMGATPTKSEYVTIVDYLAKNYGSINANTASAEELETAFALTPAEAQAIVAYRTAKGPLADIADFKSVPHLDLRKIEAKKALIVF